MIIYGVGPGISLYFQCKHSHKYEDLLFHISVNQMMPPSRGADPEHTMRNVLVLYIQNFNAMQMMAGKFLQRKGLSLEDYME